MTKSIFRAILVLSLFMSQAALANPTMPLAADTPLPSMAPMLQKVMPAVVNIAVEGVMPTFQMRKPEGGAPADVQASKRKFHSFGSGVMMDAKNGYLLTNAHVIKNGKTITVTISDGRRFTAKVIGSDTESDVAVLQIKADNLHSIPLADVSKLAVGDYALAIGNPFNLSKFGSSNQTVTFGIISALQRSDLHLEGVENFIQTDAAINPGNSGGALVNLRGELIGINTAIIAPSGGNVGIGFAIPIDIASNIMQQLIKYGSVHRGLMGIYVQQLTPELASAFGAAHGHGTLVTQVNVGSPAEKAGIKSGDLILEINGKTVDTAAQVKNIVKLLRVGDSVTIKLLRNGKKIDAKTVIADVKKHVQEQREVDPFLYGIALKQFEQHSPSRGVIRGVQVIGVMDNTPGWQAGLRQSDIIIEANRKSVTTLEQLTAASQQSKEHLLLHIVRGMGAMFLVIR